MASENAHIDNNNKSTAMGVTDNAAAEIRNLRIDDATKGLKVMIVGGGGSGSVTSVTAGTGLTATPNPIVASGTIALDSKLAPLDTLGTAGQLVRVNAGATALEYFTAGGGSGTVTTVSVASANGFSGTVANPTTTPAITIIAGAITPTSVAISGTAGAGYVDYLAQASLPSSPAAGTVRLSGSTLHGFTRLTYQNESVTPVVVPRDLVQVVYNNTASTITVGQVLYVNAFVHNVPNVGLAKADSLTTMGALFIAVDSITAGTYGQAMRIGLITGIDTSAWTSGDELYLSPTVAGAMTNVRPSGTNVYVRAVGVVTFSDASAGVVDVTIAPQTLNRETGTTATTWTGSAIVGTSLQLTGLTASQILGTDASKNLVSLAVATYPSLTELSYVKGVTSAIQTQLNARLPLAGGTMTGKVILAGHDEVAKTYAPGSGAQTVTIDCSVNNQHVVTGNASGTAITFAITGATNSQCFIISILQGASTLSTITAFFATVRWAGGVAPTLTATANKRDTFGFIRTGANTYDGFIIGQAC